MQTSCLTWEKFLFSLQSLINCILLIPTFKEWFLTGSTISTTPLTTVYDRIFATLAANEDDASLDAALGNLDLRLDELLVIGVLRHRLCEVLLNLRFFNWAGRARSGSSYRHMRATYNAIFHTLSRAGLFSVLLDWLGSFSAIGRAALAVSMSENVRFHNTLAMGYAAAGIRTWPSPSRRGCGSTATTTTPLPTTCFSTRSSRWGPSTSWNSC
ncbi:hypothetical protein QJS04_geneDACA006102 [Acorus gramineus]|uniref:Uncharacterized protein n=1 Tax=Acorus gramineus TaxID=55184 RepID=A0AAV9B0F2_ACOGR|nr:hypothetical protein QJS04_geneDACA006102 [Acorus gramineus]